MTELAGVEVPVHVMVGEHVGRRQTSTSLAHRVSRDIASAERHDLGGGLAVLGIEATLRLLALELPLPHLALMVMEACGTYAVPCETVRYRTVLQELLESGIVSASEQAARTDHIREYRDTRGRPTGFYGTDGEPIPWEICFDTQGRPQNLWRRPPLTSVEELGAYAAASKGKRGASALAKAVARCADGSASPLETKMYLLLCLDIWNGGEGWPKPSLNQRIDFSEGARLLAPTRYAVADLLWPERMACIEVNGRAYHADRDRFDIESGRTAALESMGYRVLNITYDQMSDFDKLETMLETFAAALGIPLQKRTRAFIERKRRLHDALFGSKTGFR